MSEHYKLLPNNSKTYGSCFYEEDEDYCDGEGDTDGDVDNEVFSDHDNAITPCVTSDIDDLHARTSAYCKASFSISMLAKPSDDRKNSAPLAGWNVINLIQGTGTLGIPFAVQQGGWAAVLMIFFVAFLCCHTGKILISCMYEKSKKTGIRRRLRVNYPEVGEACLGHRGHILISIIQNIEMFSGVITYVILLGTAWSDLLKMYSKYLGVKEWAAINCLITLPSLFITRMSNVSWLSMLSVFSLLSAILVLITFTITQSHLWSIQNIPAFNPETFPIALGIILFSYCAHAVLPSIEGSMKKPNQFNGMMNCSFLLAAIVKACFGTFMVFCFGKSTAQLATVNLADHIVFSRLSTALVISNVILAVPLAMFIVTGTVDDLFLSHFPRCNRNSKYHWVWMFVTRTLAIGLALFIACMVPYFGLILGVVGSLTGSCLSFIFPCVFHIILRRNTMSRWEFAADISIICFGAVAGLTGLVFSMKALVIAVMKEHGI